MKVFKTKSFAQWAKGLRVTDAKLSAAVTEMEQGLIDASLGHGLYKKRIAVPGKGKRGGARTIVAYKQAEKAFFIYGFAKNEKDNIDAKEKEALVKYASILVGLDARQMKQTTLGGELIEVNHE